MLRIQSQSHSLSLRRLCATTRNRFLSRPSMLNMSRHSRSLVLVHAVWTTFRRLSILSPSCDDVLLDIIAARVRRTGCTSIAAGCASDHVHLVFHLSPSVSLSAVMQHIKGGSSFDANRSGHFPESIRWQAGYWAESLGPDAVEPLAAYVRAQRTRHDFTIPAERWIIESPFY